MGRDHALALEFWSEPNHDSKVIGPKDRKDARLTDEFFLSCIETIGRTIATEDTRVRVGMGGALQRAQTPDQRLPA